MEQYSVPYGYPPVMVSAEACDEVCEGDEEGQSVVTGDSGGFI